MMKNKKNDDQQKLDQDFLKQYGGKNFHLELLKNGGFNIPETYNEKNIDLGILDDNIKYVVRSSGAMEDSLSQTAAGKNSSMLGVSRKDIPDAIRNVKSKYEHGGVVIQPDLTEKMEYSGVVYTNLNGKLVISLGSKNSVHNIVNGKEAETEIEMVLAEKKRFMRGIPIRPELIDKIQNESIKVEEYFGRPMDLEFAIIDDNVQLLQARPLPNPTDATLKEQETRNLMKKMSVAKKKGLDEIIFGVGNYREILGEDSATQLSVSTFNYIFAGDGKTKLGAVQLGRNELGYETGTEIYPWVVMIGGNVYYNFAGDSLQFRPEGIDEDDLLNVVNNIYNPLARKNPDLLNYPELQMYIQFPEEAEKAGLNPKPYELLVEKNRKKITEITMPKHPPKKKNTRKYDTLDENIREAIETADHIREGSAKEYVKAARLAFFALEDLRDFLKELEKKDNAEFQKLANMYEANNVMALRDAIAYDESIASFELEKSPEFEYLGSFELTLPRGFPPERHFKSGKPIENKELKELADKTRTVLEYREKVKFFLFRDYDVLRQIYEYIDEFSEIKKDLYNLEFEELSLLAEEQTLSRYRIELRKQIKGKDLFSDPIFENDLRIGKSSNYEKHPQLIFGSLSNNEISLKAGLEGYIINGVDQTISIPNETKAILVPDNVRPGSHLFTVLSDYGLPVISVPAKELKQMKDKVLRIKKGEGYVSIDYN